MKTKIQQLIELQKEILKEEKKLRSDAFRLIEEIVAKGAVCVPISPLYSDNEELSGERKLRASILEDGVNAFWHDEDTNKVYYGVIGKVYKDQNDGLVKMAGYTIFDDEEEKPFDVSIDAIMDIDNLLLFFQRFYDDPEEPWRKKPGERGV